ncbi:MAG: type II toxin-antitoxin system HipA family toxin [Verrucomicrobia bacterium]|nr:type II toxin-antitoxin system HipA family toxin [Verrucomicrobiota bacterium]MDA1068993.1 type II toxin-antitoxin system HipA family toxin [Verrucomicrobiota bacterium]
MRLIIRYHGESVGRLNDDTGEMLFQYDNDFLRKKIELSPFYLPIQQGVVTTRSPFEGNLPGLFADSLPDHWGRVIMDRRLREAGISPENVSILKRLALVGTGALGALTYHPEESSDKNSFSNIKEAMQFAGAVIEQISGNLPGSRILHEAGSNPGGRFPKLLFGWKEDSEQLMIGSNEYEEGYEPCIMKLDMGKQMPAHHRNLCEKEHRLLSAARLVGIKTPNHWLIKGEDKESGAYAHLIVQRFDRAGKNRIHTHTFGGITHQLAVRYGSSYEDLLRTTMALCKDHRQIVQQYRRMVFNVVSGNRDDHVRNHSFLLKESFEWILSPAYDLTPTPEKPEHALSINSKWNSISDSDMIEVAELFSIDKPTQIIEQCRDAFGETKIS